jgi:hypothetical protein
MLAFDRDQPIGSYRSKEYLRWTRPAGKVDLRVVAIRGGALTQVMTEGKSANEIIALYGLLNPDNTPVLGRVSFDARAGHSYYILQTTDVPFLGSGGNVTISLESAPEPDGYLKGRKPPGVDYPALAEHFTHRACPEPEANSPVHTGECSRRARRASGCAAKREWPAAAGTSERKKRGSGCARSVPT